MNIANNLRKVTCFRLFLRFASLISVSRSPVTVFVAALNYPLEYVPQWYRGLF